MAMSRVKVLFPLAKDQSGYPPFAVESVWAIRIGGGYTIDNIPFYARVVALGDVVAAEERDGTLWYARTLTPSPNSLIRVVAYGGVGLESIRQDLSDLGCSTEVDAHRHVIAVSVPETASLSAVRAHLEAKHRKGVLDYEEPILREA